MHLEKQKCIIIWNGVPYNGDLYSTKSYKVLANEFMAIVFVWSDELLVRIGFI
jgi:hypothetical protein